MSRGTAAWPRRITVAMLEAGEACQVDLFRATFGESVEVTPETIRAAVAAGLDINWALTRWVPASLRAEYQRQRAPLLAEYERQEAPLLAEYQRQRAPLLAEYERQRAALLAEYERQRAPLRAEYERQRAALLAEYERQEAPLRAEYERQEAPPWAEYQRQCGEVLVMLLFPQGEEVAS